MSTANVLEPSTLNRLNPSSDMVFVAAVTVGDSRSYYFRQNLNTTPSTSPKYNLPKQIIPTVPRQRIKAPPNSFLSPIRSERTPPRRQNDNNNNAATAAAAAPSSPLLLSPSSSSSAAAASRSVLNKQQPQSQAVQKLRRPYPLIHAISSPALLLPLKKNRGNNRRRKVSFSEHVVVVRTIIHTDDDNIQEEEEEEEEDDEEQTEDGEARISGWRRHSTGSTPTTASSASDEDLENNEVVKQRVLDVSKSFKRFVF